MAEDTVINVPRDEIAHDNEDDLELKTLGETVYDLIKDIQDPEKPETLEELNVVSEDGITIERRGGHYLITITFIPTVPHCSLAPLIGLCLRAQLEKCLTEKYKLNIYIKEGSHATAEEINKQINDKERIAAAMENPNLREIVQRCVENEGY